MSTPAGNKCSCGSKGGHGVVRRCATVVSATWVVTSFRTTEDVGVVANLTTVQPLGFGLRFGQRYFWVLGRFLQGFFASRRLDTSHTQHTPFSASACHLWAPCRGTKLNPGQNVDLCARSLRSRTRGRSRSGPMNLNEPPVPVYEDITDRATGPGPPCLPLGDPSHIYTGAPSTVSLMPHAGTMQCNL